MWGLELRWFGSLQSPVLNHWTFCRFLWPAFLSGPSLLAPACGSSFVLWPWPPSNWLDGWLVPFYRSVWLQRPSNWLDGWLIPFYRSVWLQRQIFSFPLLLHNQFPYLQSLTINWSISFLTCTFLGSDSVWLQGTCCLFHELEPGACTLPSSSSSPPVPSQISSSPDLVPLPLSVFSWPPFPLRNTEDMGSMNGEVGEWQWRWIIFCRTRIPQELVERLLLFFFLASKNEITMVVGADEQTNKQTWKCASSWTEEVKAARHDGNFPKIFREMSRWKASEMLHWPSVIA